MCLFAAFKVLPYGTHVAQIAYNLRYCFNYLVYFFLGVFLAKRKSQRPVSNFVGKSEREKNVARVKGA